MKAISRPIPSKDDTQDSPTSRSLAIFALDIDHFKQTNDTWGHLYGDQVLKIFARRMEACANSLRRDPSLKPRVMLGHPSGEEFLVLVEASAPPEQFVEWANVFRRAIADDVLPTDSEWEKLSRSGATGSLVPPPISERVTTASIGVALCRSATTDADTVADLLDRADTALYRAKASGRNQVIAFDQILSNCGRVLEYDASTRVVSLDIGTNVGVAVGQEFRLYHPTFTGKTKFLLSDGRTKRIRALP